MIIKNRTLLILILINAFIIFQFELFNKKYANSVFIKTQKISNSISLKSTSYSCFMFNGDYCMICDGANIDIKNENYEIKKLIAYRIFQNELQFSFYYRSTKPLFAKLNLKELSIYSKPKFEFLRNNQNIDDTWINLEDPPHIVYYWKIYLIIFSISLLSFILLLFRNSYQYVKRFIKR